MQAENNEAVEKLKKELNLSKGKLTTFEKEKAEILKQKEGLINKTIYEKRKAIDNTYSEVILEVEKRLKSLKAAKDKEKKENISKLVEQNTKETKNNNFYLNNEIKKIIESNKLPGFVNSELYFSLFSPYTLMQWLKGTLISIIILLVVPFALCYLFVYKNNAFSIDSPTLLIIVAICIGLIYVAIIGSIWLLIDKSSKKNPEALNRIKDIRKNIKENEKTINEIARRTSDEATDDKFDYTKIDRDIEATTLELEKRNAEKKTATEKFLNETEPQIKSKIEKDIKPKLDEIDKEIENLKIEIAAKQKVYDDTKLESLNENLLNDVEGVIKVKNKKMASDENEEDGDNKEQVENFAEDLKKEMESDDSEKNNDEAND